MLEIQADAQSVDEEVNARRQSDCCFLYNMHFPSCKFKQMVVSNKKISVKVWFINYLNSHLKD